MMGAGVRSQNTYSLMDGLVQRLASQCVYTIVDVPSLQAASRGSEPSAPLSEERPWVSAKQLQAAAESQSLRMPIVFGDAARSRVDERLHYWALLHEVRTPRGRTQYRFTHLQPLRGRRRSELRLLEGGAMLSAGFGRPYALCETPDFLHRAFAKAQQQLTQAHGGSEGDEPSRLVDRHSSAAVRAFLARYSDVVAHRDAAARALADSICAAHEAAPASWSVTLFRRMIRLNVGMPYVLELHEGGCFVLVLQASKGMARALKPFGRDVTRTSQGPFARAPGADVYAGPSYLLSDVYERMRAFHVEAIDNAASRQRRTAHRGFSPGVLRFLQEQGLAVPPPRRSSELPATAREVERTLVQLGLGDFDPTRLEDERQRATVGRARRDGQEAFRQALLLAYEGRCAISECTAQEALEAAHIQQYLGRRSQHVCNGLLLRADLHRLFDRGLLEIGADCVVRLAPTLRGTGYDSFDGRQLRLPQREELRPHTAALATRPRTGRAP
jgi:hypothetical protein